MRAVVQRVTRASVRVGDELVGEIARGLCVFVGVGKDDDQGDVETLADKVVGLRIFEDEAEKMNLALAAVNGSLLAVSQFTLFGDVSKGRRPSFVDACEPVKAAELFEAFVTACRTRGVKVETGRFRASMQVQIENDGPVTILLDTKRT